jgi:hypothetical protein
VAKATEEALGDLHGVIAEALTDLVREGVNTVIKGAEGPEVVKLPASAAYFAAAITLLKNNNISADPGTNEALAGLEKALAEKRQSAKQKLLSRQQVVDEFEKRLGPIGDAH